MSCDESSILFLTVHIRVTGGEVGATSSLAPKLGPLGLVSSTYRRSTENTIKDNDSGCLEHCTVIIMSLLISLL